MEKKVSIDELSYYFDSQRKDSVDYGSYGQKTGAVLALRQRLMRLPEEEFDAAIRTIEKIVADPGTLVPRERNFKKDNNSPNLEQARELYERATADSLTVSEISKI